MSYDLMVFDPNVAPREREAFMAWYKVITLWGEDRDYANPAGMSGNLPQFYSALRVEFPAMNGPDAYDFDAPASKQTFLQRLFGRRQTAPVRMDEAFVTDYICAENAIYMSFAWSKAELAYNRVFNAALSQGVGFFNVSANNGEILHDPGQFDDFMGL